MDLEREALELQRQLATVDLLTRPSRGARLDSYELLLLKRGELKVKMYQEPGHALPHVHIDYGAKNHVASYSIDPTERLAGNLDKKYERTATEWISGHRVQLIELWRTVQSGAETKNLLVALAGDA
ncbi:MAG: DUF4160 domain-containing protein [Rhodoferax sp.]|nr:DUF4160 domain-containing protein [Rhodoferax sp.]